MVGGQMNNPEEVFTPKTKAKGVHIAKDNDIQKPGNYMIHNRDGREFYQEVGTEIWWDSKLKKQQIDPTTLKPILVTASEVAIETPNLSVDTSTVYEQVNKSLPAQTTMDQNEVKSEAAMSATVMRATLERKPFGKLVSQYGLKRIQGMNKAGAIKLILEQLGY